MSFIYVILQETWKLFCSYYYRLSFIASDLLISGLCSSVVFTVSFFCCQGTLHQHRIHDAKARRRKGRAFPHPDRHVQREREWRVHRTPPLCLLPGQSLQGEEEPGDKTLILCAASLYYHQVVTAAFASFSLKAPIESRRLTGRRWRRGHHRRRKNTSPLMKPPSWQRLASPFCCEYTNTHLQLKSSNHLKNVYFQDMLWMQLPLTF